MKDTLKKPKTYNVPEKQYVQGKRDRKRLQELKPLAIKMANILSQIK